MHPSRSAEQPQAARRKQYDAAAGCEAYLASRHCRPELNTASVRERGARNLPPCKAGARPGGQGSAERCRAARPHTSKDFYLRAAARRMQCRGVRRLRRSPAAANTPQTKRQRPPPGVGGYLFIGVTRTHWCVSRSIVHLVYVAICGHYM